MLYYRNEMFKLVIMRCVGLEGFFREKVLFPFEEYVWECPSECRIDIWSHGLNGEELIDSMEADRLQAISIAN